MAIKGKINIPHVEEVIFVNGAAGVRNAVHFLSSIADMLSGKGQKGTTTTTKFDGCLHGDTVVLTNAGDKKIRDIVDTPNMWGSLRVVGRDFVAPIVYDKSTDIILGSRVVGEKKWVEIELENGSTIKLTEDHEVHTNRGWVAAGKLTDMDEITEL